jgi:hypothetical protein
MIVAGFGRSEIQDGLLGNVKALLLAWSNNISQIMASCTIFTAWAWYLCLHAAPHSLVWDFACHHPKISVVRTL